jgi:hypothetical protein
MTNVAQAIPRRRVSSHTPHRQRAWLRILGWLMGGSILAGTTYFLIGWPWISRWGATDLEIQQTLPGDELVPNPAFVTTKAVTINAPPEAIYPWLLQLGVDRGGMYSYLWVENWLLRLNVQNTDEIRPEWQGLQVGDFVRFTPPEYALNPGPGFYVMALEPNRVLIGCFGMENERPQTPCVSPTWQFVLAAQPAGSTRLILRGRTPATDAALATATGKLFHSFAFYMERKMLLEIKERAEMAAVGRS